MSRTGVAAAIAASAWLRVGAARAEPLGSWCVGLERLFGASWVEKSFVREYGEEWVERQTSFSFLGSRAPHHGYSSPRLGVDYVSTFGLSAGAAVGFDAMTRGSNDTTTDSDPNAIALLAAPRLGYFFQPLRWLGIWPRLGLTYLVLTRDDDRQALTLDLPVSLLLVDGRVGLMLVPYLEAGLPEDGGDNLVESGVLVSVGVFL